MKRCDYVCVPKMLWVSANNRCDYYLKGALLTAFSMMSAPIRPPDVTTSPSLHLYSCTQVWMSISSLSWGYLRAKCRAWHRVHLEKFIQLNRTIHRSRPSSSCFFGGKSSWLASALSNLSFLWALCSSHNALQSTPFLPGCFLCFLCQTAGCKINLLGCDQGRRGRVENARTRSFFWLACSSIKPFLQKNFWPWRLLLNIAQVIGRRTQIPAQAIRPQHRAPGCRNPKERYGTPSITLQLKDQFQPNHVLEIRLANSMGHGFLRVLTEFWDSKLKKQCRIKTMYHEDAIYSVILIEGERKLTCQPNGVHASPWTPVSLKGPFSQAIPTLCIVLPQQRVRGAVGLPLH